MRNGVPVKGYECQEYKGILIRDPESQGVIKHLYALIVFEPEQGSTPALIVTSEASPLGEGITEELAQLAGVTAKAATEGGAFPGLFDGDSHQNLGQSPEHADLEQFERTALKLAKRQLGLDSEFRVTKEESESSPSGGRWTPDDIVLRTDLDEETHSVSESKLINEVEGVLERKGFLILERTDLDIWDATNHGEVICIQMGANHDDMIVLEYGADEPGSYLYRVEGKLGKDFVQSIFMRYRNGDVSWKNELDWEKVDFSKEGKPWWTFL